MSASSPRLLRPPLLAPGARVALVAPAGPLRGEEELARAVENARSFGWEPVVGAHALARAGYFAGHDCARAADLDAALRDPSVDAVWCLRGGYGAMRLLEAVDLGALCARPRPLIGYSDVTALHCSAAAHAATRGETIVTYHAQTARAEFTPFTRDSFVRALVTGGDPCGHAPAARALRPGSAWGRLAGGNLALLAALVGTRHAPRFDGAIVVLEDVNEPVYRIDRMLRQLLLAGTFTGCRAIVFGQCTDCPEESDDGARSLDDVVAEVADVLRIPALVGVPVGHVADQWALPLGARAELDAVALTLCVDW
jgi:muramoyltetrapeptide carboxypeptidase